MLGNRNLTKALPARRGVRLVMASCVLAPATLLADTPAPIATTAPATVAAGMVLDRDRHPVSGARVTVISSGSRHVVITGSDGRYEVRMAGPGEATLLVEAAGFPPMTLTTELDGNDLELAPVILARPTFSDEVVVTAAGVETRIGDTAASMSTLSRDELWAAGSTAIDGALRQVPGFALFRRSGSRTANPTSQGVSLRGVGASGASRAVVLDDGVPLNDAFGGWVYWARVPRAALGRVEVLRGGGADVYGSGALGGVVQLFRDAGKPPLFLEGSYGSQDTPDASAAGRLRRGPWSFASSAEAFRTDGYVAVASGERGPIDTAVASRHSTVDVSLERAPSPSSRAFVRGAYFEESRENGTPFQVNDTRLRQLSAGLDARYGADDLSARAWATREVFDQTFSGIAADRRTERPTRAQRVPSSSLGAAGRWSRAGSPGRLWVAGAQVLRVSGETDERVLGTTGESREGAGGRQWQAAVFAGSQVGLGARLKLAGGARLDSWRNERGRLTAGGVTTPLAARGESALSPRLSLLLRASPRVSVSASAYRGFRAPTLNELYRSFRVGNVFTAANEKLQAERMNGLEAGALLTLSARARLRANLFWMDLDRTVANVTVSVTPALITRQRRNLGSARSRGAELDAEARIGGAWAVSLAYLLADATVTGFPADPSLQGLRLPQVPRHSASLQLRHDGRILGVGLQARWTGTQFDDDQNRLPLRGFVSVDAEARRPVGRRLEAFLGGENLTGARYDIGRTPVRTVGPPRSVRAGLRVRLGGPGGRATAAGSAPPADAARPRDGAGAGALRPEPDEDGVAE
jgi:outer membrane receptor protein involved in Fe transport